MISCNKKGIPTICNRKFLPFENWEYRKKSKAKQTIATTVILIAGTQELNIHTKSVVIIRPQYIYPLQTFSVNY